MVQPPTAYPKPGVYDAPPMITLLADTPNATIHYTLDDTTPTQASPVFDPYRLIPLEQFGHDVPEGGRAYTIRAIAVAGDRVSDEAVLRYEIEPRDRDTFVSEEILPGVRLIRDFQNNKTSWCPHRAPPAPGRQSAATASRTPTGPPSTSIATGA